MIFIPVFFWWGFVVICAMALELYAIFNPGKVEPRTLMRYRKSWVFLMLLPLIVFVLILTVTAVF